VQQLLITPTGHEKYHLFSDAIERYKQYRSEQRVLPRSSGHFKEAR